MANLKSSSKKRKSSSSSSSQAQGQASKKHKYRELAAQKLPWKALAKGGYDFDEDGGVLELEEVEDVDIVWQETAGGGRTAKFMIREDKIPLARDNDGTDNEDAIEGLENEEWTGFMDANDQEEADDTVQSPDADDEPVASTSKIPDEPTRPRIDYDSEPFDDTLLPEFAHIPLLPSLKRAIHSHKFTKPSEIQNKALSAVLTSSTERPKERDIVGVAETGSGKTLAYSLPILQDILVQDAATNIKKRPLAALILCPTRELALQVRQHVGDVVYRASIPPGQPADTIDKATKPIPRVNIVTICGGMSVQKQKRMLSSNYGVDIIVATPGRLWDMLEEDEELGKAIKGIRFLVLDEADRMIENGHFAELENIIALTKRSSDKKAKKQSTKKTVEDEVFKNDFEAGEDTLEAWPVRQNIKTYVFSATMSKELQRNVQKKGKKRLVAEEDKGKLGALGDLIEKLDFRDEDPLVIDLTVEGGLVKQLQEVKVDCLLTEKDYYLYYFILRYPGRTLVFLSSIDAIRRLKPLMELLQISAAILHSGMQQRARLKALDRFKTASSMVLLATDVAARGLDVPAVDHVVHYQLPRTADTYIHRSGRTARAGKEGLSLQLCAPEEKPTQRALLKSLNKEGKLQELSVDYSVLTRLTERVELARKIETAHHRAEKAAHEENWLQKAAAEMEIDLDEDGDSDGGRGLSKRRSKTSMLQEKDLRVQLKALLAQPLMLRGLSAKYLTAGGSSSLADQMLSGSNHKSMLGFSQSKATEDHR